MSFRKVLKKINVGEIQPDETVEAVKEATLLAKVRTLLHIIRSLHMLQRQSHDILMIYILFLFSLIIQLLSSFMIASWMGTSFVLLLSIVRCVHLISTSLHYLKCRPLIFIVCVSILSFMNPFINCLSIGW